jgi:Fungal specific transcription factor domain
VFSGRWTNGLEYEVLEFDDPSPSYALSDDVWQNPEQSRLANLGCWVLSHDPLIDRIAVPNASVWLELLPQLVHSTRTAYTAAAAFGAVYESCLLSNDKASADTQASTIYSKALSVLQQDLVDRPSGTAPLLVSCILLACVEVVQRHRENAHRHLEGAFKILEISDDDNLCLASNTTPSSDGTSSRSTSILPSHFPKKDDLALLLKSLDLHTATYTSSKLLHLAGPVDNTPFEFTSISGADLQLLLSLHSVHHFTSPASRLKYLPPSQIPRATLIEQGHHLGRLTLWLKCLDENVLHPQRTLDPSSHRHALMLRAQCLVAIINTSAILSPYEVEYDRHAAAFREVIDAAAVVIDGRDESAIKFRPGLGIIQPLLFTALKYRNGRARRRAISLLKRSGVEGPWVGWVEAAVAERTMKVEEEMFDRLSGEEITEGMIPERKRVCGTHLHDDYYERSVRTNRLRVSLSRCVDVEYMISGKEGFESGKHWNVWMEDIDIDVGG